MITSDHKHFSGKGSRFGFLNVDAKQHWISAVLKRKEMISISINATLLSEIHESEDLVIMAMYFFLSDTM